MKKFNGNILMGEFYELELTDGSFIIARIFKRSFLEDSVWIIHNKFVFECEVKAFKKLKNNKSIDL